MQSEPWRAAVASLSRDEAIKVLSTAIEDMRDLKKQASARAAYLRLILELDGPSRAEELNEAREAIIGAVPGTKTLVDRIIADGRTGGS